MLNYENLNAKQKEYVDTCSSMYVNTEITKSQIKQVNKKLKMKSSPAYSIKDPAFRLARGVYKLPVQSIINRFQFLKLYPLKKLRINQSFNDI